MRKLIYVANVRLPTEKAHGIQIMKMCEAFSRQGLTVELWVPNRHTPITEDPFDYYWVQHNFIIKHLPCIDLTKFGKFGFLIQSLSFSEVVAWHAFFRKKTLFFTRDAFIAMYLKLQGKKVSWEAHMGHINIFIKLLILLRTKLVVITKGLLDFYIKQGVSAALIHVAPDGVDIEQFDIKLSKEKARRELGLPLDKKLVVYTGSRQSWKGVETLEEASKLLPSDIEVLIVSGKPYTEIPKYLKMADVLVLPNTAKEEISRSYTSPMKLFEYMASGTPIIASDLPSLREILNEQNAILVKADDPLSLSQGIEKILNNKDLQSALAKEAREDVERYTWDTRAKNTINFIT